MPQRIVDLLEAIEIDHQHGQRLLLPLCASNGFGRRVGKARTVGEPGQLIVMGEAAQPQIRALALAREA